jgi:hypothetical protein
MATEISQNFQANMKRSSSMITPGGSYKRPIKKTRRGPKKGRYSSIDKSTSSGQRASGLYSGQGEGPFPRKLATTLLYRSDPSAQTGTPVTGSDIITVGLNDLFDFDNSNDLGNKQPLFYDQLFSAAGPYVRLECKSWRTAITLINTGAEPLSVYWNGHGVAALATDEDTLSEYTNRPYVQVFHLGPNGSSMDRCIIKSRGKWSDHNTDIQGTAQNYNGSPSTVIFGSLFTKSPSSLTAPTYVVAMDHYFDIVALRGDATSS